MNRPTFPMATNACIYEPDPSLGERGEGEKNNEQNNVFRGNVSRLGLPRGRDFGGNGIRLEESGWRREYLLIPHVVEMGWKRNNTHLVTRLFAKYHPLEQAHDRR